MSLKIWPLTLFFLLLLTADAAAQNLQAWLSLEARGGYATNRMMVPFYGEWDRSEHFAYGLMTPSATLMYDQGRFSTDLIGGGFLEPVQGHDSGRFGGAFASWTQRYRVGSSWGVALDSGVNRMSSPFGRTTAWVQPQIWWQTSPFSRLNLRVGSSFRGYDGDVADEEEVRSSDRFDLYGVDWTTWLGFRWQVRGSFYGQLDDPLGTTGLQASLDRLISDRLRIGIRAGVDQFRYQMLVEGQGGPGGFPGGPGTGTTVQEIEETDRIWRAGLQARYQVSRQLSLFAAVDQNLLRTAGEGPSIDDLQISGGVRFSLRPRTRRGMEADVEWQNNRRQLVTLKTGYRGEGSLYLIGDFNDWQEPGIPLREKQRGRHVAELELEPGGYEYKILLMEGDERRWIEFGDDTYTVPDGFGGENGLLWIE